jgi:hypothetical protein
MVVGMNNTNDMQGVLASRQYLKNIGRKLLANRSLSVEENKFIGSALLEIVDGGDPKAALNIKGTRITRDWTRRSVQPLDG